MQILSQERSRSVAKAIERAMVSALRADSAKVTSLLDTCRSSLFAESYDDVERTEIARRVAEAKISILYERENARDEFMASWGELEGLGYSSLEREASMLVYYVKFSERSNVSGDADRRNALNRLEALISQLAVSGDENYAAHYKAVHVDLSKPGP